MPFVVSVLGVVLDGLMWPLSFVLELVMLEVLVPVLEEPVLVVEPVFVAAELLVVPAVELLGFGVVEVCASMTLEVPRARRIARMLRFMMSPLILDD